MFGEEELLAKKFRNIGVICNKSKSELACISFENFITKIFINQESVALISKLIEKKEEKIRLTAFR